MIVSYKTIQTERLDDLFNNLVKKRLNASKRMSKNVIKSPGRALDNTANIATAAASRNRKAVSSTLPEMIAFFITGKGV